MGRARPTSAASDALLGVAKPDFLECYPRTCVAAQLAVVPRDRGAGGDGVDRALGREAAIRRVGRVFEAHHSSGGPRRLDPPYKQFLPLAHRASKSRGLLAH